jgi:uncharacterized protein YdiU (UPF0061 family)
MPRVKLGLFQPRPDDLSLAQDLFERMARNGADFTLVFRRLCDAAAGPEGIWVCVACLRIRTHSTIGR